VTDGASERHIYNTADWDESFTVIPTGVSGVPGSEFYLSQTKTYVEGGFYSDLFSDEAVKEAAVYVLKLKPGQ
jgi:acyl-homoserine lactone acylase PvdQ